jgi:serine/threonine protein kinase
MLEFNPNKRISAADAILDSYFDDIRLPEQEIFEPPKIELSIDDLGNENLSLPDLKQLVFKIINNHKSDDFDFENDTEEDDY